MNINRPSQGAPENATQPQTQQSRHEITNREVVNGTFKFTLRPAGLQASEVSRKPVEITFKTPPSELEAKERQHAEELGRAFSELPRSLAVLGRTIGQEVGHIDGRWADKLLTVVFAGEKSLEDAVLITQQDLDKLKGRAEPGPQWAFNKEQKYQASKEAIQDYSHSLRALKGIVPAAAPQITDLMCKIENIGNMLEAHHGSSLPAGGQPEAPDAQACNGAMKAAMKELQTLEKAAMAEVAEFGRDARSNRQARLHQATVELQKASEQLSNWDAKKLRISEPDTEVIQSLRQAMASLGTLNIANYDLRLQQAHVIATLQQIGHQVADLKPSHGPAGGPPDLEVAGEQRPPAHTREEQQEKDRQGLAKELQQLSTAFNAYANSAAPERGNITISRPSYQGNTKTPSENFYGAQRALRQELGDLKDLLGDTKGYDLKASSSALLGSIEKIKKAAGTMEAEGVNPFGKRTSLDPNLRDLEGRIRQMEEAVLARRYDGNIFDVKASPQEALHTVDHLQVHMQRLEQASPGALKFFKDEMKALEETKALLQKQAAAGQKLAVMDGTALHRVYERISKAAERLMNGEGSLFCLSTKELGFLRSDAFNSVKRLADANLQACSDQYKDCLVNPVSGQLNLNVEDHLLDRQAAVLDKLKMQHLRPKDAKRLTEAEGVLNELRRESAVEHHTKIDLHGQIPNRAYGHYKKAAQELMALAKDAHDPELKSSLEALSQGNFLTSHHIFYNQSTELKNKLVQAQAQGYEPVFAGDSMSSAKTIDLKFAMDAFPTLLAPGTGTHWSAGGGISASRNLSVGKDEDGSFNNSTGVGIGAEFGPTLKVGEKDDRFFSLGLKGKFGLNTGYYYESANGLASAAAAVAESTDPATTKFDKSTEKNMAQFLGKYVDSANASTGAVIQGLRNVSNVPNYVFDALTGKSSLEQLGKEANHSQACAKVARGHSNYVKKQLEHLKSQTKVESVQAYLDTVRDSLTPTRSPSLMMAPTHNLKADVVSISAGVEANAKVALLASDKVNDALFEEDVLQQFGFAVGAGVKLEGKYTWMDAAKVGTAGDIINGMSGAKMNGKALAGGIDSVLDKMPFGKEYVDRFKKDWSQENRFEAAETRISQGLETLSKDYADFVEEATVIGARLSAVLDRDTERLNQPTWAASVQTLGQELDVLAKRFLSPEGLDRIEGAAELFSAETLRKSPKDLREKLTQLTFGVVGHTHAALSVACSANSEGVRRLIDLSAAGEAALSPGRADAMLKLAGGHEDLSQTMAKVGIETMNGTDVLTAGPVRQAALGWKRADGSITISGNVSIDLAARGVNDPTAKTSTAEGGQIVVGVHNKSMAGNSLNVGFEVTGKHFDRTHPNALRHGDYSQWSASLSISVSGAVAQHGTLVAERLVGLVKNSLKDKIGTDGEAPEMSADEEAQLRLNVSSAIAAAAKNGANALTLDITRTNHRGKLVYDQVAATAKNSMGLTIPIVIPPAPWSVSVGANYSESQRAGKLPAFGDSLLGHTLFRDKLSLLDRLKETDAGKRYAEKLSSEVVPPEKWSFSDAERGLLREAIFSRADRNFLDMLSDTKQAAGALQMGREVVKTMAEIRSLSQDPGLAEHEKLAKMREQMGAIMEQLQGLDRVTDGKHKLNAQYGDKYQPQRLQTMSADQMTAMLDQVRHTLNKEVFDKAELKMLLDERCSDRNFQRFMNWANQGLVVGNANELPSLALQRKSAGEEPWKAMMAQRDEVCGKTAEAREKFFLDGQGRNLFAKYVELVDLARDVNNEVANSAPVNPDKQMGYELQVVPFIKRAP